MRTCSKCNQIKPCSEFHNGATINGKKYIRGDCKVCQKDAVQKRRIKLKAEYVDWKKSLKCNRCGNNDYRVLQFHHLKDKEYNISNMLSMGFSLENMKKEMNKCEVLCANCHQIEHFLD